MLSTLKARFEKNMHRHKGVDWARVEERLKVKGDRLKALQKMEDSGGDPDVVGYDAKADVFIFMDCSAESPKGRRSICYDKAALDARKENKPADSAMNMAATMGVEMITEEEYRELQQLEALDLKTSSWVKTPDSIRKLGGALFCDRRYNTVFTYHNGAESYYAARGFRAKLTV